MAEEEKLYNTILSDELTWEGLIRDIINEQGLDPWNIDICKLADKYLNAVKKLKELDIKMSGKFILAAAILLKMKSDYLLTEKEPEEEVKEKPEKDYSSEKNYELKPHIPQPKQRKVTLNELVSSLKNAIKVNKKRKFKKEQRKVNVKLKLKEVDLGDKISKLYSRIVDFFQKFKEKEITFSTLVPSKEREDVIWTFVPLVHLANKGKINIKQKKQFGEIYVREKEE